MKRVIVFMCLILAVCMPSFADIIYLKSGGKIEGKIISETDEKIEIKMKRGGKTVINRSLVDKIERKEIADELVLSPKGIYKKRAKEIDESDFKAHFELGVYCVENSLYNEAEKELQKASELDPSSESKAKIFRNLNALGILNSGIAKINAKLYKQAIKNFESVAELYSDTPVGLKAHSLKQYCLNQTKEKVVVDKGSIFLSGEETRKQLSEILRRMPSPKHYPFPPYYWRGKLSFSESRVRLKKLERKGKVNYAPAIRLFIASLNSLESYYKTKKRTKKQHFLKSANNWYEEAMEYKVKAGGGY